MSSSLEEDKLPSKLIRLARKFNRFYLGRKFLHITIIRTTRRATINYLLINKYNIFQFFPNFIDEIIFQIFNFVDDFN